jgi:phosphoglycerol transferase MdoB-like AlkP superfamily enzyme
MNAMSQGMRGAFDSVNFNDVRAEELAWIPASWADRLPAQRDFLVQTRDRIEHRALHLFGIQEMPDYMGTARNRMKGTAAFSDAQRRDGVIDFLSQESNQPSFVQVHFMTGHCCKYQISKGEQHFSVGRTYRGGSVDHYDDAIRYMDSMVGDILEWLEQEGRLDETLIVVSSDHSRNWETEERLPLLIRFPGGMPKGHIQPSAQLIDVPPTMIEYLGLRQPEWMVGESLLGNNALDPQRPIFSASKVKVAAFRKPKPLSMG